MRSLLILALALGALVVSTGSAVGQTTATSLRITYWEDGAKPQQDRVWTLRCSPARGTLAQPARACARLMALGFRAFAPLPRNIVCTELYGGPQVARIVGTIAGKKLWATVSRTNGCEIGRWNGLVPWLLPPGGIS